MPTSLPPKYSKREIRSHHLLQRLLWPFPRPMNYELDVGKRRERFGLNTAGSLCKVVVVKVYFAVCFPAIPFFISRGEGKTEREISRGGILGFDFAPPSSPSSVSIPK